MPPPQNPRVTESFAANFAFFLRREGLKVGDLCQVTNLSEKTLEDYLRPTKNRGIKLKTLTQIATFLNVEVSELFKPIAPVVGADIAILNWQSSIPVITAQEIPDIKLSEKAFNTAIGFGKLKEAFEISYRLADDYRLLGDYPKALSSLGFAEGLLIQKSGGNRDLMILWKFKIQLKRILIRDFISLADLKCSRLAYNILLSEIKLSSKTSKYYEEIWQVGLNCKRQIAEIDRLCYRPDEARKSFYELKTAYRKSGDKLAAKYCMMGIIECDRLMDSRRICEKIDKFVEKLPSDVALRMQARLRRASLQAERWEISSSRNHQLLVDLKNSIRLKNLFEVAKIQKNFVYEIYSSLETISISVELVGHGILPESNINQCIHSLSKLKNQLDGSKSSLPMELAHVNLHLAEAYLIKGDRIASFTSLIEAENYYGWAEMNSGILRSACLRSILNKPVSETISHVAVGVDAWYLKHLENGIDRWRFSLTSNLP